MLINISSFVRSSNMLKVHILLALLLSTIILPVPQQHGVYSQLKVLTLGAETNLFSSRVRQYYILISASLKSKLSVPTVNINKNDQDSLGCFDLLLFSKYFFLLLFFLPGLVKHVCLFSLTSQECRSMLWQIGKSHLVN